MGGTYLIQQKIASGGMGDVYKAIHRKLESPVALKIVRRELLGHAAMVHRFQQEARAASKLRHPNLVAVTDFGQADDGTLFMVMEYVTGKSLARVIAEDAPLPERRVVHIGAQILAALTTAHANDILHRDLKPENVMIESRRDAPDWVKVLDFGILKLLAVGAAASTLTQAGLVCGTPGYMSPEQLRGDELDPRSDVFSVGVVLYEMLTLKLPFEVQTPMEMLHRHLSEPIVPPGERRGEPISPDLEDVVMRSLSPRREARPASAEVMREQLLGAAKSISLAGRDAERRGETTEVLPRRELRRPSPAPGTESPGRPDSAIPLSLRSDPVLLRTRGDVGRPGGGAPDPAAAPDSASAFGHRAPGRQQPQRRRRHPARRARSTPRRCGCSSSASPRCWARWPRAWWPSSAAARRASPTSATSWRRTSPAPRTSGASSPGAARR